MRISYLLLFVLAFWLSSAVIAQNEYFQINQSWDSDRECELSIQLEIDRTDFRLKRESLVTGKIKNLCKKPVVLIDDEATAAFLFDPSVAGRTGVVRSSRPSWVGFFVLPRTLSKPADIFKRVRLEGEESIEIKIGLSNVTWLKGSPRILIQREIALYQESCQGSICFL